MARPDEHAARAGCHKTGNGVYASKYPPIELQQWLAARRCIRHGPPRRSSDSTLPRPRPSDQSRPTGPRSSGRPHAGSGRTRPATRHAHRTPRRPDLAGSVVLVAGLTTAATGPPTPGLDDPQRLAVERAGAHLDPAFRVGHRRLGGRRGRARRAREPVARRQVTGDEIQRPGAILVGEQMAKRIVGGDDQVE